MKFNRFFRYIWRINALVIFGAGLLAIAVLAYVSFNLLRQHTGQTQVSNVVVSSDNTQNSEVTNKLLIGSFAKIEGSEIVKAPVYLSQEYQYRYGSKEASSIQNYIFYNPTAKTFTSLRNTNQGLILSVLPLPNSPNEPVAAIADLYVIIEKDTNNDQKITESDQKSVAIADASGQRFKTILPNVDDFKGASGVKDNRVSIFYTIANQLKVTEIDLRSQEILNTSTMSPR